jgi:hypothetical protein
LPQFLCTCRWAALAGKFQRFDSESEVTTTTIVTRLLANATAFHERNRIKQAKEIRVQQAEEQRKAALTPPSA